MELATAIVTHLRELSASIDDPDTQLVESVTDVTNSMQQAVPSYRGLRLTILREGYPVTFTVFEGDQDDVATSLRVPLKLLSAAFEAGSRIVYYAATPGAFIDLAADMSYALKPQPSAVESSPATAIDAKPTPADPATVELDTDLPPPTRVSGVSGMRAIGVINQAVGVLIGRGHHPDHAHSALRRHAAAAGLDPHSYAIHLLATLTDR